MRIITILLFAGIGIVLLGLIVVAPSGNEPDEKEAKVDSRAESQVSEGSDNVPGVELAALVAALGAALVLVRRRN